MTPKLAEFGLDVVHWSESKAPALPARCRVVLIFDDASNAPLRDHAIRLAKSANLPILHGESNRWTPFENGLRQNGFELVPEPDEDPSEGPSAPFPEPSRSTPAPVLNHVPPAMMPSPPVAPPPSDPRSWVTADLRSAIDLLRSELAKAGVERAVITAESFDYERREITRGRL